MAKSRIKQMEAIQEKAAKLAEEVDLLIEEFGDAYDNMPENLQNSERGERAQDRIGILENWHGELEAIAEEGLE